MKFLLNISIVSRIFAFIKHSLSSDKRLLSLAFNLSDLVKKSIKKLNKSNRSDLNVEHFDKFFSTIVGLFLTSSSYHNTIIMLALSGYGLNSFNLVRTQMEAMLIFLYLIEPFDDLNEISKRVEKYKDWIAVKSYQNCTKSKDFPLSQVLSIHQEYVNTMSSNYKTVKEKYKNTPNELKVLENSVSFLKNKKEIAKRFDFIDTYNHIQAECSASVHVADIHDRVIFEENKPGYFFSFNKYIKESTWVLMLSNLVQVTLLVNFIKFCGLEKVLAKDIVRIKTE